MVVIETDAADADVVVGIITYKRPEHLRALLDRLTVQEFTGPVPPRVVVLVVDNSPGLEARPVVDQWAAAAPFRIEYVAHGAGNIASGRNALLDESEGRAPILACIDDDELPDPTWLQQLVDALRRTGADIVVGPVLAHYPAEAPGWLDRPVFHSVPGDWDAGWVSEAWTGNYAMATDSSCLHGLRFDEALGASGGEDQLFFRQARDGGGRIFYEPGAVAREPVPRDRLAVRYLLRREYRKGSTLGLLDRSRPGWPSGRPGQRLLRAGYWFASGCLGALAGVVVRDRAAMVEGLMRTSRSLGMVSGLLGRTIVLYGETVGDRATSAATIAFVAGEGPRFQNAGHSRYLDAFVSHYRAQGFRIAVVVTSRRTGFLLQRRSADAVYYAPALRNALGWQFFVHPAVIASHVAWASFRRLPHALQNQVDRVRTRRRAAAGVDHVLGTWPSVGTSRWTMQTLEELQPDVVFYNTIFSVPQPASRPASVKVQGLISHDVVSQRADSFRAAGHAIQPSDFSASQEAAHLDAFDTIVAIQWDDARTLRSMAPRAHVVVTPVAMPLELTRRNEVAAERCLFVGSGSLHNVEAVTWFLENCWPAVVRRRPTTALHVIGTVCARLGDVPANVVLRGEVADLAAEYASSSVVVAPLRSGSGLKVKVVEAMCHGVATVTTTVGAQGLGAVSPRPYLLADDADAFAAGVVHLLEDPAARAGLEAAASAAAHLFSPEQAYAELDGHLAAMGVGPRRSRVPSGDVGVGAWGAEPTPPSASR
ncbi:glycosyltransferase [Geodermatophilus sp. CPCC 205506]|uniref:glycosyltransferase n=1 Tax=Geodermatophilus sp. CPCC 205506 TaxID=2936596 RepID=UPI003EEF0A6A